MNMSDGKALIGTSGWVYKHWRKLFYPEELAVKDDLRFYATEFKTAEINNSFYKLPSKETYENWASQVQDTFVFSVKASRYLTHMKKLKDPEEPWSNVVSHAAELGDRLGPILLQFPERWRKNAERLQAFLELSADVRDPKRIAFEFRNETWFDSDVYSLLEKYQCALCIADSDKFKRENRLTADFTYIRFHGRGENIYADSYSKDVLKSEAARIKKWLHDGIDVYVYFNNDGMANAIKNARTLRELIEP
jgi:uncharacterized protein YecE (DUF72 family)